MEPPGGLVAGAPPPPPLGGHAHPNVRDELNPFTNSPLGHVPPTGFPLNVRLPIILTVLSEVQPDTERFVKLDVPVKVGLFVVAMGTPLISTVPVKLGEANGA